MVYKSLVKGKVVVLKEGMVLPEDAQVEVVPVQAPQPGSPAALLEVSGSDVPDAIWDTVEMAIAALDRADCEHMRQRPHA